MGGHQKVDVGILWLPADSQRQPGSDPAPGETESVWSMRDLP